MEPMTLKSMKKIVPVAAAMSAASLVAANAPQPYGAVPSARQVQWHELEFYGFLHFTVNTFTDKEWGYGDEKESVFNPTAFDADQIVSSCAISGMKGLILTAKHHDGFCLWPSKFTEHSVKNSPWKNGKGDVVRDIADACKRHNLKFGVYLSPWDRNHKDYGRPAYVEYYRNQLRELLTNYGPIFEVWYDGANGGDGYYGGAKETRNIDRATYYGWPETWKMVRALQPDACMFSDVGPDVRWVGNEGGTAGDPCWATLNDDGWCAGNSDAGQLNRGHRGGKKWIPAECDVSIRPGWFYHAHEDDKVRSLNNLMDLYFASIGRGGSFLLNVPPDRRGLVHENDARNLAAFGRMVRTTFSTNLAKRATVTASNVRGNDKQFDPSTLLDGKRETYWASDDTVTTPEVTLEFKKPVTFSIVRLCEYLPLGQRVDDWAVDIWKDGRVEEWKSGVAKDGKKGEWEEIAKGTAIGSCRLVRIAPVTTTKVRLRITKAPVCPAISEMGLFLEAKAEAGTTVGR